MTAPHDSMFSRVGPFTPGADPAARRDGLARLYNRLDAMPPLPDRTHAARLCRVASVDPSALPRACAALDALPSKDRRKLIFALLPHAGTHPHPTTEA